ncbi:LCP family protein [Streptomyces sp. A7024]|uniref:LCP family protein n=1 Tax=Streptomyces coryli TaxID=1128680 RepID=A0A6G4U2C2_9ACTN|nr:LCP family protein [Streptomyces coryli]NGN65381.1 LCP family protein [Streptomyces coryli]
MNDWPDAWNDNRRDRSGQRPQPEPTRVMPTQRPGVPPQHDYGRYDDGYNEGQVYGGGGGRGPDQYDAGPRRAPNWGKRIKIGLITLLVVVLAVSLGTYFWADSKMRKEVDLSKVEDRPSSEGTNTLIVGSDSRAGLSDEDKKRLHTGSSEGNRTDSMMILHEGDNGNTLISIPRDWYVTIPAFKGSESGKQYPATKNKINSAYSQDGPGLLVRTIEYNTGLKMDHYAEIGFGGFANIVDELGGVEMCFDKPIKDKNSGADFKAGCQDLNGEQALAMARNRYALADGDLGRTKNQQKLLNAIAKKAASPGTIMNPFSLYPTMGAGLDTLVVDKDNGPYTLLKMFMAMKSVNGGDGNSLNLPTVPGGNMPGAGSVLKWDEAKAKQLLEQVKNDEKVTVTDK